MIESIATCGVDENIALCATCGVDQNIALCATCWVGQNIALCATCGCRSEHCFVCYVWV